MAREDKGKFLGLLNSKYITEGNYDKTFAGSTLIPSKLKVGATEEDPYGFVIDAIDIDWGGLSMRSVTSEKKTDQSGKALTPTLSIVTHVSYDSAQNAKEDKGIISTGYALAKISESFENIIDVIGKNDETEGSIRNRIAANEKAINTLTGGDTSTINNIMGKITRIEQELTENPNVDKWVTWVDSLKAFEKGTNVKEYIDTNLTSYLDRAYDHSNQKLIDAKDYTTTEINKLNSSFTQNGSHINATIKQTNGKITEFTITESNFDYEHIAGEAGKTLKATLDDRDKVVTSSLNDLNGRIKNIEDTYATTTSVSSAISSAITNLAITAESTDTAYITASVDTSTDNKKVVVGLTDRAINALTAAETSVQTIKINGKAAGYKDVVNNKLAYFTIGAEDINVGGTSDYKDKTVQNAIETLGQQIKNTGAAAATTVSAAAGSGITVSKTVNEADRHADYAISLNVNYDATNKCLEFV